MLKYTTILYNKVLWYDTIPIVLHPHPTVVSSHMQCPYPRQRQYRRSSLACPWCRGPGRVSYIMSVSHHLLPRGSPLILAALLYYWAVAAHASSSIIALYEQSLCKRNWDSTLKKIFCSPWLPGITSDPSWNLRTKDSITQQTQTQQPQYANWKTKRKSDIRKLLIERYLEEEDDEVLFDSNGMPIQLDDDHDLVSVGDGAKVIDTVSDGDKPNTLNSLPAGTGNHAEGISIQSIKPDQSEEIMNPSHPKPDQINSNNNQESQSNTPTTSSAGNHETENKDDRTEATFTEEAQETTTKIQSVIHNKKLFNNTHNSSADDSPPADTIVDDILRGFSFAFFFCICMICLHKACRYACIRCGILPDDRVVEARWRRLQLKNKRPYFNPHCPPNMDTRSLGKWFDQRDRMHPDWYAGIWDSSAERSVGSWDDGSDGDIGFDDDGIQLSAWDKDDASSAAAELEYGEGDELEDKDHDERLFDLEDGGEGMKKEANKFFDWHARKNHATKEKFGQIDNNNHNNNYAIATNKVLAVLQKDTRDVKNDISDDSFFDALASTSRRADVFDVDVKPDNKANVSSAAVKDCLQKQDNSDNLNHNDELVECGTDEEYDDNVLADDRGYDEESDLLGLRSDSPPPLDLQEIEKKLRDDMENAKSFY